jgi:twitching motility protein PilT
MAKAAPVKSKSVRHPAAAAQAARTRNTAIAADLEPFLVALEQAKGTDLILTAGQHPLIRVDGALTHSKQLDELTPDAVYGIVMSMLTDDLAERFLREKELDFSFSWHSIARFRANAFFQRGSVGIAVRLIPYEIPTFEQLGLPESVRKLTKLRQGLVLVTGPTGSGKSTTLASIIESINETRSCHIITIENPIEYVYRHRSGAVNQREIGEDTHSFEAALRSALREDPDVLLVGEMRDLETIQTTLTIAETGHLVFGTLHTNDTSQTLDRIVDVFPTDRQQQIRIQLSNTLTAVIYQQLLPRPEGGRVAAFEVLIANGAVRNLIKEGKTRQLRNVLTTTTREGNQTIEMSMNGLIERGLVNYEDAVTRSLFPNDLQQPAANSAPDRARARRGRR